MKKLLPLFAACALCFTACESSSSGNDDNNGSGNVTPPTPTEGVSTEAYYAGASYENPDAGNYWINFYPDNLVVDDLGDISGDGYILCLSFRAPMALNPDQAVLAQGQYTGSEDGSVMTFIINDENETYLTRPIDGETVQAAVTGGTIDLKITNGVYQFDCNLIIDGGETFEYEYVGDILFHNRSEEGMYTTLKEDRKITGLSQGYVELFGESLFEGAQSDMARIVLGDDNFDILSLMGKGNGVVIDFNIPQGAESIPDGKYTMSTSGQALPPETLVPGMIYSTFFFGCWYFGGQDEAALCNGTVDISHTGSTYNISFTLKDGYNHVVSGSYSGELLE